MGHTMGATVSTTGETSKGPRESVAESSVQALLHAIDDADCRGILDATSGEALSAKEVSAICDLPHSTTYRKLDLLTEAGLLEERTRIRQSGKHASEYIRSVDEVVISLDPGGEMEVRLSSRDRAGPGRSAGVTTDH